MVRLQIELILSHSGASERVTWLESCWTGSRRWREPRGWRESRGASCCCLLTDDKHRQDLTDFS